MNQNSEIIIYEAPDGTTKLQVQLEDETVWLTQEQIAQLFGKAKSTINEHIKNIYAEEELNEKQTLKKFGNSEFQQKALNYYNLDVIISVGYRVKSKQGTKFRQWATKRIHEYIVKGFTMDDDRLKQEGARSRYFEELLQRIRDIRSSERNFYQKVTDIYTTSIDYKNDDEITKEFFSTVQNKIHFAIHGKTAAEMINERVDAKIDNGFINISVVDNGIGLSHDDLKLLFRIDVHYKQIGNSKEKGTGLGLIICKEFVTKNNGKIWIDSTLGQGTKATFTLPLDEGN